MNKTLAGVAAAGAIATGGTVVVDRQIDPYTDRATHYELPIKSDIPQGERVEIAKDRAAMTLKGWNDEYAITIEPQIPSAAGVFGASERPFTTPANRPLLSKKMEYRSGNVTAFIEPKADTDNEFDIDFTLHSKPDTNVFTYKIDGAEEFDFFYQPALTEEEIENGAERPHNVVGSYAVYHKEKANHELGKTNYGTGKAFHIYRPKAIDANGVETWCELSYQDGTLAVTCGEKWLETAAYPVIVDPTFGSESIGGSVQNLTVLPSSHHTMPVDSQITSMTGHVTLSGAGGPTLVQFALYSHVSNTDVGSLLGYTSEYSSSALTGWVPAQNMVSPPTVTAGTKYYVTIWGSGTQTTRNAKYDTGTTGAGVINSSGTPSYSTANFPDPYVSETGLDRVYSIYANYTCTSSTCILGNPADNGASTAASSDSMLTSSSTASSDGTVSSLSCRLWLASAGTANWRGVIYSNSGNLPTNLLAVTNDSTFSNTTEAEVTANFTGANQIAITSGTSYFIGFHIEDPGAMNWNISRGNAAGRRITNGSDAWSGGAEDPHNAEKTVLSGPIDCYVTYTTASGGSSVLIPDGVFWFD